MNHDYINRQAYVSRRRRQRRRQRNIRLALLLLALMIVAAGAVLGISYIRSKKHPGSVSPDSGGTTVAESDRSVVLNADPASEASNLPNETSDSTQHKIQTGDATAARTLYESPFATGNAAVDLCLNEAHTLALSYDYDAAIERLQSSDHAKDPSVQAALASYEETRSTLVRVDPTEIPHIFFHSLIMDNAKAFDGDYQSKGYNQVMTTSREFLEICEQMYERGYVLVKMHDMAYEETAEDGTTRWVSGDIMLPPGKKAFVMSQDDVCYYEYMAKDGFASRIVIGDDGKPTCEMKLDDGTTVTGSYDLVPLLDDFIEEHPDFSYKGARAVLAFTGYEGVLGYRTDPEYKDSNPNYEADCEAVRQVAQCLRDNGWELASHSWGHINMRDRGMEAVKTDADKWENRVESLIGETDIILYPFGADIGDWRVYTRENEKFAYLYDLGFRYFCNVDSSPYWVQMCDGFLRQGRRNIDGYRMYYDLPETNPTKTYLDDLIDVETVFDPDRPKPVAPM